MTRNYTGVFQRVGEWWIAWAEELPGANTQGRTLEEARENLLEAIQLMLEMNRERSQEELAPEGRRHTMYWNPNTKKGTAVPRHTDIAEPSPGRSAETSASPSPSSHHRLVVAPQERGAAKGEPASTTIVAAL